MLLIRKSRRADVHYVFTLTEILDVGLCKVFGNAMPEIYIALDFIKGQGRFGVSVCVCVIISTRLSYFILTHWMLLPPLRTVLQKPCHVVHFQYV